MILVSEIISEPRCKCCNHTYRKLLDELLRDKKYSLYEVQGIANALGDKNEKVSIQAIRRHFARHVMDNSLDSALEGFNPERETLAKTDQLLESLVYGLTILTPDEYEDFMTRYLAELEMDTSGKMSLPVTTVERFSDFYLEIVLHSVPQKFPQVKTRFIEKIKEIYPKIRL